jgi:subtilisin family serine protease
MRTKLPLVVGMVLLLTSCKDLVPTHPTPELDPGVHLLQQSGAEGSVRVIVRLRSRSDQATVGQQAQGQGAKLLRTYRRFPLLAMEVNENALRGLLRSPHVVSVVEDVESPPALDASLDVINADDVHALGWVGQGLSVAILDTGIDRDHPFVDGRVVEEACFSTPSANRESLCPDGTATQTGTGSASIDVDPCQDGGANMCDHGQHVAGIAAGNGMGVPGAPAAGVAPAAAIIGIQVFRRATDDGSCGGNPGDAPCVLSAASDQIAALEHVLDLAANYTIASVNMSLGGGMFTSACDDDSRKDAVDALLAANIATVISSGNQGFTNAVGAPSCISTAVAVGATTNADAVTRNRGPLLDLFAPGQGITSSVNNAGYANFSGTSMAAPHVAGAWAVLRQVAPTLNANQILTLLQNTGVPITYLSDGSNVTTPRIDLLAAVQGTTQPPVLTVDQPLVSVDEGSVAANSGTFSDPDGDPVTLSASVGTVTDNGDGNWSWSFTTTDGPAESQTVTITGTDDKGAEGQITFTLQVLNVPPSVDAGPDASITSNEVFEFSGTFSDPGLNDAPWSFTIDWGDGTTTVGSTNNQALPILASHQYCAAGPYTVSLTVVDKDGGSGSDAMVLTVDYLGIEIDITPSQHPNSVSLSNRGLLPLAVLSSVDFDATQIDPATVSLGDEVGSDTPVAQRPNGRYYAEVEDVNGDGLLDVVFRFAVPALLANGDLGEGSTSLVLRGFLGDGCTNFRGEDSVRVVP